MTGAAGSDTPLVRELNKVSPADYGLSFGFECEQLPVSHGS
ncbi:MAG TPA: hypothetical protein VMS41_12105 [Gaiellaceae bacterium]|nr:hypothetical protein [Gaiellaceae bacterium]